jgi:hypothetical protein
MFLNFSDLLCCPVEDSADVMAIELSWNCHPGKEVFIYSSQGAEANVCSQEEGRDRE